MNMINKLMGIYFLMILCNTIDSVAESNMGLVGDNFYPQTPKLQFSQRRSDLSSHLFGSMNNMSATTKARAPKKSVKSWHRKLGYTVLLGAIGTSITGSLVLKDYKEDKEPGIPLKKTHAIGGILTGTAAIINLITGFMSENNLESKRKSRHKMWSIVATTGLTAATIMGFIAANQYKEAEKTSEVSMGGFHQGASLTASCVTIFSVAVMLW